MSNRIARRTLGTHGLEVAAIGLGCMGMSDYYGPADAQISLAVLNRALDIGVNFLDTADMYGYGDNEVLLGKLLQTSRREVFLATKFGFIRDRSRHKLTFAHAASSERTTVHRTHSVD